MEVKDLVKKLGFDLKEVEEAKEADELIEKFHAKEQESYFEIFKNELGAKDLTRENLKSFIKTFKENLSGEYRANLDRNILKIIPDLKAEELKEMKLSEKLDKLSEAMKEKFSSSKDVKELQEKLIASENSKKEIEEQAQEKVKKAFADAESKLVKDKVDWSMKSKFLNVPKEKLITGKHNEGYFIAANSYMGTKYDFSIDEKGEIIPMVKGSQQRVTDKKDGKEYFVTVDDLLSKTLDELGFIQKSNGGGGNPPNPNPVPAPGEPKNNGTDHSAVFSNSSKFQKAQ